MVEKMINEQTNKVVGGGLFDKTYLRTKYEDLKSHFGLKFNMYQAENHIGEKVIVKGHTGYEDRYYVGILISSKEEYSFLGSTRCNVIAYENDRSKQFEFINADGIWTYIDNSLELKAPNLS